MYKLHAIVARLQPCFCGAAAGGFKVAACLVDLGAAWVSELVESGGRAAAVEGTKVVEDGTAVVAGSSAGVSNCEVEITGAG
jgi:hypothetical protein